jgi:hypothetical protein
MREWIQLPYPPSLQAPHLKSAHLYNNIQWHPDKLRNLIWLGLFDYGRMEWKKVLAKCKSHPMKAKATKDKFKMQWCSGGIFAEWMEECPRWKLVGPRHDFVT